MRAWLGCAFAGWILLSGPLASAHEVRPAYLELTEWSAGRFAVVWKEPILKDRRLRIDPILPERCGDEAEPRLEVTRGALIRRWSVDCGSGGLEGQALSVDGLESTLTDVLVRIRFADGRSVSRVLRPGAPQMTVLPETGASLPGYLVLGVEHLLFGLDHILFLAGLLFFVRRAPELLRTITAFTLAHSITLALSALGVVRLSQAPVEAVIALSILFLAVEAGRREGPATLTSRFPWVIAFAFGLLHGFGFAGALADIGLPRQEVALALFLFNVGIEVGQLLVVAALLGLLWLFSRFRVRLPEAVIQAPRYAMGVLSAYWLIGRLAGMI